MLCSALLLVYDVVISFQTLVLLVVLCCGLPSLSFNELAVVAAVVIVVVRLINVFDAGVGVGVGVL